MKKTKTKCYLYTRVSTSMQVDGYSLDAQRDKLRKYAEYEDMVVAGEYSDEGFSGKNIQGRHEFQRMLQDIQDCKDGVEYVLVFKLSRFGRNAADVLNSLQLMQDFGVNLICVEDGIDSSKDSGKLMISVLSAVAEIERENIRTQTMAGREQKAREGKWNGGFAPYGYRLEKGELLIAEDEVDVIRTIFDRYIHTNDGVSGVAKYLNRQGFVKKLRQNGTIPGFSASFVKSIIDNPVYMGKIAYGRRRTEKKIGTRNEMHVVEQSEFPVYEGKHEAIISEEDWNLAQEKRKINAYRREKVNDPTHAHILSGILKCPCCGKSLYGNIAKAHSKDKKTRYYYYCKNTVTPTGHECTFRLNIEQTEMNRMVASIISAMVSDPRFANAIKAKIGSAVDTNDLEKQLEALQAQLRQTLGTKARLERQMDGLDVNDPYYDRKISDLQRRYDEQYGRIDEIEVQIDDVQSQIRNIRQEKISGDNIYRLLLAFDQVYEAASEVERKEFMRAFIERIELFPEKQLDGNWIRKIIFNFPVPVNGTEVKELPLENETMVEDLLLLLHFVHRHQLRDVVQGIILSKDMLLERTADLFRVHKLGLLPLFPLLQHRCHVHHIVLRRRFLCHRGRCRRSVRLRTSGRGRCTKQGLQRIQELDHILHADKAYLALLQQAAELRILHRGLDAVVDVEDIDAAVLFKAQPRRARRTAGRQHAVLKHMAAAIGQQCFQPVELCSRAKDKFFHC